MASILGIYLYQPEWKKIFYVQQYYLLPGAWWVHNTHYGMMTVISIFVSVIPRRESKLTCTVCLQPITRAAACMVHALSLVPIHIIRLARSLPASSNLSTINPRHGKTTNYNTIILLLILLLLCGFRRKYTARHSIWTDM